MREIPVEELYKRGTEYLWLYASVSKYWNLYDHCNNYQDRNYLFIRRDVKFDEQNVYVLMKTSQHCYTVTHYCVVDGSNELKKFAKLYDAACYLMQSWEEYEGKLTAYRAETERLKEEKRIERTRKHAG